MVFKVLSSRMKAFGYSIEGVRAAFKDELAFRLEMMICLVAIPAAFFVTPSPVWRVLLIVSTLAVPAMELLNSAVEAIVDLASPEKHHLAKKAKDTGSAAVLVCILNALVVWGFALFCDIG